jgi:DNA helicase II / ATP-dependent DNA helicase PcrA
VITTPHLAKGLEFDQVIVPFCNQKNYATNMDKHLLYVACTRAMHNLHVTAAGALSPLIQKAADAIKEHA